MKAAPHPLVGCINKGHRGERRAESVGSAAGRGPWYPRISSFPAGAVDLSWVRCESLDHLQMCLDLGNADAASQPPGKSPSPQVTPACVPPSSLALRADRVPRGRVGRRRGRWTPGERVGENGRKIPKALSARSRRPPGAPAPGREERRAPPAPPFSLSAPSALLAVPHRRAAWCLPAGLSPGEQRGRRPSSNFISLLFAVFFHPSESDSPVPFLKLFGSSSSPTPGMVAGDT